MFKVEDLRNIENLQFSNLCGNEIISGAAIDSRKVSKGSIYFALRGRNFDGHQFVESAIRNGAVLAVVENDFPESSLPHIRTDNVIAAMGKIAQAYRKFIKGTVIGITGSNGKTTTKEMIFSVLSKKYKVSKTLGNLNNYQGLPLTLLNTPLDCEYAVIEIGTNSPGEIKYLSDILNPDIALITNIGDSHLEKLVNRFGVLDEKLEIFRNCSNNNGTVFINRGDELLAKLITKYGKTINYGTTPKCDFIFQNAEIDENGYAILEINDSIFNLNSIGITSSLNARAAYSVCKYLGVDDEIIAMGLKEFSSEGNRLRKIKILNCDIILDCYNANPSSMKASLDGFSKIKGSKSLIIGDMKELGMESKRLHETLFDDLKLSNFDTIILIGDEMRALHERHRESTFWFRSKLEAKVKVDFVIKNSEHLLVKASRSMELETLISEFAGEIVV
ncbi:MAG: UDP-N-acetylmuramoyl-tripeptide--D-alanyl-D-alanine ligase [Candidatus Delongbacteria bacterium]|nr:UDP-N-acetylmuramoyl-tripeptide--D-alanyl-D-alanine ligase [Candidatus Delongbacteria bacterium]MBN2836835.1 UDP-N-acetylmuramoyl-tripeptide--D-alanyl-D-alanine ligase [Candidatus Delongbacteria bacterium]